MLSHLLAVLKDPSPTHRVKAIRALREIVKADPCAQTRGGRSARARARTRR